MKRISLLLSFILLIVACHTDGCGNSAGGETSIIGKSTGAPVGKGVDVESIVQKRGTELVNACTIVSLEEISELLGVNQSDITIKNSSPRGENVSNSSCFFRFEDPRVLSAGILIQVLRNPMGPEYYEYATKYIESKVEVGEQTIEGVIDKFETFEGFGDDGAFSTVAGKYFWRMGNSVIFGIAFNTAHTPEQQYEIATKLARSITLNYMKV